MESLLTYKTLIFASGMLAIIRGLFFPDFRFGLTSVIVIQLIFPLLLFLVLVLKSDNLNDYKMGILICLIAIIIASIISFIMYNFLSGGLGFKDPVSGSLFIGSMLAQVLLLSIFITIYYFFRLR